MKTNSYTFLKNSRVLYLFSCCLWLTLTSCVVEPCWECDDNYRYSVSEEFDFSLEVDGQNRFEIDGINGSMEIIGTSQSNELQIWGKKEVQSNSREDASTYLPRLTVNIIEEAERFVVYTAQPSRTENRNFLVYYYIRVPQTWMVYFDQINGPVIINTFNNKISGVVSNGDVNVQDIAGQVEVKTTNGNIHLWNLTGSVKGIVTNGSIEGKIILPAHAICDLKTVNGQIGLFIPESTSAELYAGVVNGRIIITNLDIYNLIQTQNTLTGKLNTGEGQINVETVNGNISITGF